MIIKCRLIPDGFCVNLFGTLWTSDKGWIDKWVINHERIHNAQQRELLYIPFYIMYILEWLCRLVILRNWKAAYYAISFEQEAYLYGHDLTYLKRRKHYGWIKYLKRRHG